MRHAEDRLSRLPKNCMEVILIRLPIRDAVRTSVLSRDWRYEWMYLSEIVFDESILYSEQQREFYARKLIKIIDQVCILHRGPIHKFKLCTHLDYCNDIDRWVHFLSRNGIKELTFDCYLDNPSEYKMPYCLFSCGKIIHLELHKCIIKPPSSFNGFSKLETLDLQSVTISKDELECLITNSPLLRKLKLVEIVGCTHLKLCAPKLVDLEIESYFEGISCVKTLVLDNESIKPTTHDVERQSLPDESRCKLISIVSCLPQTRRLALLGNTYEVISSSDVTVRPPVTCPLLHLSLNIHLISNKSSQEFWGAQEDYSYLFSQLQILNLTEFTGTAFEMEFVKFVLANAPLLKLVQIHISGTITNVTNFYRNLSRFPRLSPKAELDVIEPEVEE